MSTYTQVENSGVNVRSILGVNGVWASRKNHTFRLVRKVCDFLGARKHLSEHIEFAETTRNQVAVLRSVQRKYFVFNTSSALSDQDVPKVQNQNSIKKLSDLFAID